MKIGVLSDTHDRVANTRNALVGLKQHGAELLIHCGDICGPEIVSVFEGWPVQFVFGNNDGQWERVGNGQYRRDFSKLIREMEAIGATWQHPFGHTELAGKKIGWTHGDNFGLLADLERSGAYDYVFCGHTHVADSYVNGSTRVINPGALHRARPKTCIVLDLDNGAVETIVVE
ncbi:MAG: metallophosphoesterase family protein [Gemmataceae bacterium]